FPAHPGSDLPVDPGPLWVLPAVGRVAHADEGAKRQSAALRGDRHRLRAHPRDRADDDLGRVLMNAGLGRMSALGANRTRRDGGNDVNDPEAVIAHPLGGWL